MTLLRSFTLLAIAYAGTIALGFLLYVALIRSPLLEQVDILFYRGVMVAGVAALDAALVHVGLGRAPAAPRAWGDRLRGTRRLVKCHALIAVSQTLLFLSYFCLLGVL